MKTAPVIRNFMTPTPKSIGPEATLEKAADYMRKFHLSHVPVVRKGRVAGVISEWDIRRLLDFGGQEAAHLPVSLSMITDCHTIHPNDSLKSVLSHMSGLAKCFVLVEENSKLVGLFTAADALRALNHFLKAGNF